jgi:hypothetical protein
MRKHCWQEDRSYTLMRLEVIDVQEERRIDRVNKGIAGNDLVLIAQSRYKGE